MNKPGIYSFLDKLKEDSIKSNRYFSYEDQELLYDALNKRFECELQTKDTGIFIKTFVINYLIEHGFDINDYNILADILPIRKSICEKYSVSATLMFDSGYPVVKIETNCKSLEDLYL